MKTMTKFASIGILLLLALPALLLPGCGSDVAKSQGCPSGSYLANSTDTITSSADITWTVTSGYGSAFSGGSRIVTPITFTVHDVNGDPRNNICLIVYTDGFWFTDNTYSTLITGAGPANSRAVMTNDTGAAVLYWRTENLPAANPVTEVAGTPPTYTPGADLTGTSFIDAYSGAHFEDFLFNWTVTGEPAP